MLDASAGLHQGLGLTELHEQGLGPQKTQALFFEPGVLGDLHFLDDSHIDAGHPHHLVGIVVVEDRASVGPFGLRRWRSIFTVEFFLGDIDQSDVLDLAHLQARHRNQALGVEPRGVGHVGVIGIGVERVEL